MWVFLSKAFISLEEHREKPGVILVKARWKGDIERVFPGAKVSVTPKWDYRYRAEVPRRMAANAMAEEVMRIFYDNLKETTPVRSSPVRHDAYLNAWGVMFRAQGAEVAEEEGPRGVAARAPSASFRRRHYRFLINRGFTLSRA